MRIVLDALCMEEKENAHVYLKDMMDFPDYYGENLDALYDCLTDLGDTEIVFEHAEDADGYFMRVYRIFQLACDENDALQISPEEL